MRLQFTDLVFVMQVLCVVYPDLGHVFTPTSNTSKIIPVSEVIIDSGNSISVLNAVHVVVID